MFPKFNYLVPPLPENVSTLAQWCPACTACLWLLLLWVFLSAEDFLDSPGTTRLIHNLKLRISLAPLRLPTAAVIKPHMRYNYLGNGFNPRFICKVSQIIPKMNYGSGLSGYFWTTTLNLSPGRALVAVNGKIQLFGRRQRSLHN